MTKHLVIPDCQVKPGVDLGYLEKIGKYWAEKKPDMVICLGDFADMAALSSWDKGKKSFEGRRYKADVEYTILAMETLLKPVRELQEQQKKNKKAVYTPRMVLTLGNHEDRIDRVVNDDPKLDGTISIKDLKYEEFGWEVYPFLTPVVIDGVVYCHYLTSGVMGRPITSAAAILSKRHQSAVVGHQQGRQVANAVRADGKLMTAIICGSCYEHNEDYLGPQGNNHFRGLVMLHQVEDGQFDEMFVSLDYLKQKYK